MDNEDFPVPEATEEFEIARNLIKEKGIHAPETQAFLGRWSVGHEQGIEKSSNTDIQILGQIEFEQLKARLWRESEAWEDAVQAVEDAAYIARQQGMESLAQRIEEEIGK